MKNETGRGGNSDEANNTLQQLLVNYSLNVKRDVIQQIFLIYQCQLYCPCYVFRNSLTISFVLVFFCVEQNNCTAPFVILFQNNYPLGSSFRISANIFQIWSKEAGYEQIALGCRSIRNGKIVKRMISSNWMRPSMIWGILQIEVCVMRLVNIIFRIHTKAS